MDGKLENEGPIMEQHFLFFFILCEKIFLLLSFEARLIAVSDYEKQVQSI